MTDISLKEAISFAFKKVRENFFLFFKLGTVISLFIIGLIVLKFFHNAIPALALALLFLGPLIFPVFILLFILKIFIPLFILIFILVINVVLIRISFKLINNESAEFKIKLDKQTKKFSLVSILLGISLLTLAQFLLIFNSYIPLIILFIIWFILFSRLVFFGHLIIDKNLGIKESLKKSFILTRHLMNNLGGLFRLLVLSVLYLIALLGVYIVILLYNRDYYLFLYLHFHLLYRFFFLIHLILTLILSFIAPILFLIISYFYKRLVEQVEGKNLL
jgi:hypothetical protein